MSPASFIAEVSSNHGRDLKRACAFIDAAADAGCAGVKFQQFRIDELFAPEALAADDALGRRRDWELPVEFNAELAACARDRALLYSSTPFYWDAIGELEPHVDFFKISSYQVLWLDFLREVASTGKPVVLATGMADSREVEAAVDALRDGGCAQPTLLHCVSLYPTPAEVAGLKAIESMRSQFGVPIGWSDHSASPEVVERAVRRFGAEMVEFHMDLDSFGDEYHFGHCWLPDSIGRVIAALGADPFKPVADTDPMDGDGRKQPIEAEAHERSWRTDPIDGLRPLSAVRASLTPMIPAGDR
ncbi:MAG: sialic acid synthase SpsE [Planctomycetota bacterium]|jgi:sialic acid synthase SpsE